MKHDEKDNTSPDKAIESIEKLTHEELSKQNYDLNDDYLLVTNALKLLLNHEGTITNIFTYPFLYF